MKIKIREAILEDLPLIVDFQLKMALETENLILDDAIISEGIKNGLLDKNKATYFIAEIDNVSVGSLMITKEWSDCRNTWVIWIQSVYVSEKHREKGVYKSLYNHIKTMVDTDSSYSGIRLYVDITNTKAQDVYSKLGMNGDHYKLFEFFNTTNL